MIDRIAVENFKSLRRVDLKLGRMNLFIGANASGKSNFLEALRVLQGIGNGFTISEILDGKPKSATNATWEGVRGGSGYVSFSGIEGNEEVSFNVRGRWDSPIPWESIGLQDSRLRSLETWPIWALEISFRPTGGKIVRECFSLEGHTIYRFTPETDSDQFANYPANSGTSRSFKIDNRRPALEQFASLYRHDLFEDCPREHPDLAARTGTTLANMQRLDPAFTHLRSYSDAPSARRMGDRGENFAALVQSICEDEKAKDVYLSWLRELRPEEIDDAGVVYGAVGEPLFILSENGRDFPAQVLSDGTLRFAALAAALFQPDMPSLLMMEEIENGIHASRLRLLLELLRGQAEEAGTQIVATTHSATVLDWLSEEDYKTTFFCKRDEETGESRIRALADVPRFLDVVKETPASELFAEGWLEAAP